MYEIKRIPKFVREYNRLVRRNSRLEDKVERTLVRLESNPFEKSLRTHKVHAEGFGLAWSSSVSGDIRIIWRFVPNAHKIILLLAMGGHSGGGKVYK